MHQRAHGFRAQDDLVTYLDMLEAAGQRPVRHLDRIELNSSSCAGARRRGIGAQQGLPVSPKSPIITNSPERKRKERGRVTRQKQPVRPVFYCRDGLGVGQVRLGGFLGSGGVGHQGHFGHVSLARPLNRYP